MQDDGPRGKKKKYQGLQERKCVPCPKVSLWNEEFKGEMHKDL